MAKLASYGRGSAFDYAVAGFAAAALGFAAFAMPDWRLNQLVAATGLPEFLAAAQPPLGMKARAGFALLVALMAFGTFFALLRAADLLPSGKRAPAAGVDADEEPEPIRLRRADAHPDAPARRPLVAGRELGEPVAEEDELLLEREEASEEGLPSFLVAQEPEEADAADAEADYSDAPDLVWGEPEHELTAELAPEAAAEPEPAAVVEAGPPPIVAFESEPAPQAEPAPAPAAEGEESITRLMKRLEFGLARREKSPALDAAAVAAPAEESVGHRLRSAISDLEKLAARG